MLHTNTYLDQLKFRTYFCSVAMPSNKTPKKSPAEFPSHKFFQRNDTARIHGNYHESSDCFEYPKKSLLHQATQKTLAKIFLPKKIVKSKISNPKNPLIIPVYRSFV